MCNKVRGSASRGAEDRAGGNVAAVPRIPQRRLEVYFYMQNPEVIIGDDVIKGRENGEALATTIRSVR